VKLIGLYKWPCCDKVKGRPGVPEEKAGLHAPPAPADRRENRLRQAGKISLPGCAEWVSRPMT
jgi:hypothetical protein